MNEVKTQADTILQCGGNETKLMKLLGDFDKCGVELPTLGVTIRRNGNGFSVTLRNGVIVRSCSFKGINFFNYTHRTFQLHNFFQLSHFLILLF